MIHILYGEDDFSIREVLDGIKIECGGTDLGMSNTIVFDGAKITPEELTTTCNTVPFLANRRLVIVNGLLQRFEQKGRQRKKQANLGEWDALIQAVVIMPESTVLVFVDGNLSEKNELFRRLIPHAKVKGCAPPRSADLENWIRRRVRDKGSEITPTATRLLAETIGSNLWIMASEIDKLCLYAADRRINENDIKCLVGYAKEANIFVMVDSIVQRRLDTASQLLYQLLNDGAAPAYLLFMITRQFRFIIQAKQLLDQGVPPRSIGSRIGLTSGFALDKTLSQAHTYQTDHLGITYNKLLNTDVSIKTGVLSGEVALDILVSELCTG